MKNHLVRCCCAAALASCLDTVAHQRITYSCMRAYTHTHSATTTATTNRCPAGHYCPQRSAAAPVYPAGTYSNLVAVTAATGCTACDAGRACPSTAMLAPTSRCACTHTTTATATAASTAI